MLMCVSLKSGASADDVYCIKLWYYDLFNFINYQCTPRESSSNLDSDDENSCEVSKIFVLIVSNVFFIKLNKARHS